ELGDLHRLEPDDAPRRVAAADAHRHASVRDVVHGRVPARGDRRVADARVRDEVPELDLLRLRSRERERRVRVLPEDVRVVGPRILETLALGELHQLDHPRVRRVGKDGDAEAQGHGGIEHTPPKSARTMIWLYLLLAVAAGVMLPLQYGINA